MSTRRANPRLVKIHRTYTVEEIANLFGIHKNTVREWIKRGLPVCDSRRPVLVLGQALRDFLQLKRAQNKRRCLPNELYCLRCRIPKPTAGNMADFQRITDKTGNLIAICPDCETIMHKRISMAQLEQIRMIIDITFPQALEHIGHSGQPTVNSDFK